MTQTLRDLQADYIKEAKGDFDKKFYRMRRDYLRDNSSRLVDDFAERVRDDVPDGFAESWEYEVMDHIISKIDWDSLGQCNRCHKFYDYHYDDATDEFCSEDCEEDYEEPVPINKERGER